MSASAVGFWFALIVLAWWAVPLIRARIALKREKRAECARIGHNFAEPFASMGTRFRNCQRCGLQQHHNADSQEWL